MTTAKEYANGARVYADGARTDERAAERCTSAFSLTSHAQSARLQWVESLIFFLRFVDAPPEPVVIPPVPQPSEEAKRRGLLVGAIVRDHEGTIARVVSHGAGGHPLLQIGNSYVYGVSVYKVTLVRPAPATREPNEEARRRGLYIGAQVVVDTFIGDVIAWDGDGNPVVEPNDDLEPIGSWLPEQVTLAGGAS